MIPTGPSNQVDIPKSKFFICMEIDAFQLVIQRDIEQNRR